MSDWPTELYIDGAWVPSSTGETLAVEDPSTQQTVATVAEASVADTEAAIVAARRAFDEGPWAGSSPAERLAVLRRFGDALEAHEEDFVEAVVAEAGCTVTLARTAQVKAPLVHFRDMVDRVLPTFAFRTP